MNPFVKFMVSPVGRIARIVAGVALIAAGLIAVGGTSGLIVAAIGLVPLSAGLFDVCLFAPAFRLPLGGSSIRRRS